MRDLLFKNLTSNDHRKKKISSFEVMEKKGVRTTIRRHFVCRVLDANDNPYAKSKPEIYIRRNCDHIRHHESFFCRMKASIYAKVNKRCFLILFGHSLKIDTRPISTPLTQGYA